MNQTQFTKLALEPLFSDATSSYKAKFQIMSVGQKKFFFNIYSPVNIFSISATYLQVT